MKTHKIIILFLFVLLELSCNKIDELNSPISGRSSLKVVITSDVETIVLKKLKNPSDFLNLSIQDRIGLIPHKSRNGFKALLYDDGNMETEFYILDPGGMTELRDDVPESDLPEVGKIVTENNLTKIYDVNGVEINSHPTDQTSFEKHVLEIIDREINGYPDILTYANNIDNLPGGSVTHLNGRYIKVDYPTDDKLITEIYDLNIQRLVGFISRNNSGQLILRQLISYDCIDENPILKRTWLQTYGTTVNGFETVDETTQYYHDFAISENF